MSDMYYRHQSSVTCQWTAVIRIMFGHCTFLYEFKIDVSTQSKKQTQLFYISFTNA